MLPEQGGIILSSLYSSLPQTVACERPRRHPLFSPYSNSRQLASHSYFATHKKKFFLPFYYFFVFSPFFRIQTISVNRVSTVSRHAFPQRAPLARSPPARLEMVTCGQVCSRGDFCTAGWGYRIFSPLLSSSENRNSSRAEADTRCDTPVATSGHQLSAAPRRDVDAMPEDVRGRPTTPPGRRCIAIAGSSLQFPADWRTICVKLQPPPLSTGRENHHSFNVYARASLVGLKVSLAKSMAADARASKSL